MLRPEALITAVLTTAGHAATEGRMPTASLVAVASGFPVPVMALSALRLGGARTLCGLGGLAAIWRGAHTAPCLCRLLSAAVAVAGCPALEPQACLPALAAACWPAFPEEPAPPQPHAEPRPPRARDL